MPVRLGGSGFALDDISSGDGDRATIRSPRATVYRFLGVGLTLDCRGDAALCGGGRAFPDWDGLVVIGADADIGDDVLSIPKEDWDFKTDDAEAEPPVPGSPETVCGFIRAEAPKEFGGELGGENATGGKV
jgi:hypothetical protein